MSKNPFSHKQIRKDMKKDELRDLVTRGLAFAKSNTENVVIAAVILLVVSILVPLYFRNQAENEKRAAQQMLRALSWYQQPVATGGMFANRMEKYKRTQQAFAEVATTFPRARSVRWAKIGEANSLFCQGEYEKALAIFRDETAKQRPGWVSDSLNERQGACLENLNRWPEALAIYQKLLAQTPPAFQRSAVLGAQARCLARTGQQEQALAVWRALAADPKSGIWGEQARQQLAAK